jgi:phosphonate transport system substrate-binding protein
VNAVGVAAALALAGCRGPEASKVVRITGIPDENPTELLRKYEPMVDYLRGRLGRDVEYVPVTDYGAAVQALSAGHVDFAWLGGFAHVQCRVMAEGVPLAMRDIDREFRTVFIAHEGSGIAKLEDLKGKKFAFGAKASTSGHLMPRHHLASAGIVPERDFDGEPVYTGAHDATVALVSSGRVHAGALNFEVWERVRVEGRLDLAKVSVFWTTPPYVDYVWTSRRNVDPELRDRFARAFLDLDASNPAHQRVLALQGAKRFVAASPEDFAVLEAIARSTGLLK